MLIKRVYSVASLALLALTGCIPIKGEVSLNSSGTGIGVSPRPLVPGDGIAVLAESGADDDDGIALCVRDAVARASPAIRIMPAKQVRTAAGGLFGNAKAALNFEEISRTLHDASARSSFVALKLRYVFTVTGKTEDRNWHDSATSFIGYGSSRKSTNIEAVAWDAATGERLQSFQVDASGNPSLLIIGVLGILEYTPTESAACRDIGGQLARSLSLGG